MTDLPPDDLALNDSDRKREEVYELADALLGDALTAEEARRLDELVCNDLAARRHYVRFMHQSAKLCQWSVASRAAGGKGGVDGTGRTRTDYECGTMKDEVSVNVLSTDAAPPINPSPLILDHFGYLGGTLACYAVAAAMLGLAVVAAWAWNASGERAALAVAARTVGPSQEVVEAPPAVGRITKLPGDWRGQETVGTQVHSGRNFLVAHGVLQIVYNSGATVTLEGPAVFSVGAANGGLLHLGRATVCTPKAADRPLFCVRSQTAVVTERGDCEFGLNVDRSGASRVCVFRGAVEFHPPEHWAQTKTLLLENRDWLYAECSVDGALRIDFIKGRKLPEEFVTQWLKRMTISSEEVQGRATTPRRRPNS